MAKNPKNDQIKAAILIVAIVGVIGFVIKTTFFRGGQAAAPPPPPLASNVGTTQGALPETAPQVRVDSGNTTRTGPGNPFRSAVAPSTGGGSSGSSGGSARIEGVPDTPVQPLPLAGPVPESVEFRLDGVLVGGGKSFAIVTRNGESKSLGVGALAAYGYRITAITPGGIRLRQKNSSKFVRVGERLDPPNLPPNMVPRLLGL